MSNTDRVEDIFTRAKKLLDFNGDLTDQQVDREFIFRYEYGWQLRANKIRELINEIAGIGDSSSLLPEDERPKMLAFMELTKGLMDLPEIAKAVQTHGDPAFRPFDEGLRRQYEVAIDAGISGNPSYLRNIESTVEEERRKVQFLQEEVLRVARQYAIVPLGNDLWNRFSLDEIDLQVVNLRNYFIFDYPLPMFLFPVIQFIESATDKPITRWLSPSGVISPSPSPATVSGLRPRTRIRTWSVYFLSRRGAGSHTEEEAVRTWNDRIKDTLAPRNYREDRSRLLASNSIGKTG